MNPIQQTFSEYKYGKKVVVFAEALYLERYELLTELSICIPTSRKDIFLADVDNWLAGRYGLN